MNSYFASVEQQANPHLRGRPVGVCEHLGGIIIAPSVEAKRLGIKLGTTVWEARKIYPKIGLLPVDPDKYRSITARFLKILCDYTGKVEKYSIDEAFVDVTELSKDYDEALLLALEIKRRIRQEIGEWVSCSIGIGPNKLIAKIAADLDGGVMTHNSSQPPLILRGGVPSLKVREGKGELLERICVIKPEDIPLLYDRLNLTDVPGIGPRLEKALHKLGIFTLKQLAEYPVANLINQFGINGYVLRELGRFEDCSAPIHRPINGRATEFEQIKSIGHMYTLPKPISDLCDIKKLMFKLAEKIGRRMRRRNARGNIIHYFHSTPSLSLPIRPPKAERTGGDERGVGFSKQHKLTEFISDGRDIYRAAWGIFTYSPHYSAVHPVKSRGAGIPTASGLFNGVKIMGISVSGFSFEKPQEPLFESYKKPGWLIKAMDKINDKYGEFTITRGRLIGIPEDWGKDTVGFGRMKEFFVS